MMTDAEINALKLDDAVRVRDTAQRAIDMLTDVAPLYVEREPDCATMAAS